ncbi:mitochondrial glycerol-3-phosphate dehydrogenase [Tilletia horrida]|uniref:Glycerol-3-phosphate dehydrogenase n=1 Tax=Tilletia horrida TaxID=155126 RepID=A0AAN6GXC3_9BASI|nr:mitochondrial glycerol-3-phosphate dehydrogenase [Tilletia horrida]KAK0556835.1 mitochondrial glycerol-3-phosphate dehydrogenase [Tilletia horrida]KAK0569228.1 mitochondrial glycerol-3-phosphate dehydrogenase [Tilletia horrida]
MLALTSAALASGSRAVTRVGSSSSSPLLARRWASSSSSSSGATGSSSSRRTFVLLGSAAAASAAVTVYTLAASSPLEADAASKLDIRPHPLWSPPSRAQMLAALKANSAANLRPRSSRLTAPGGESGLQVLAQSGSGTAPAPNTPLSPADPLTDDGQGFDLLIVGGGATGAGVAVDAASRGLNVAMVERDDFGAGTSSKSTKLVHGGVRYLQKAVFNLDIEQYRMVVEALHERKTFLHIAPYLSDHLPIMLPVYRWWQVPYYWAGTKMYDFLAGSENMESSYVLGRGKALEAFPMLKAQGLAGAVVYYDGQHNDTRMNVALALTAVHHGAVVANHTEVVALHKKPSETGGPDRVCGARIRDCLTGDEFDVKCKGVINATGPFSDTLRKMDAPTSQEIVAPSSGVHITLPGYYSPRDMGLIDPQTSDGRVIFFLPWQGNTIAGTTDTAAPVEAHPRPKEEEIQWILDEVRNYLSPDIKVRRGDVLSAWSGLRPLVKDPDAKDTQSLVRNHMINVSESGLLTIAGGKWTTYREMAEQTVDRAIKEYNLKPLRPCVTKTTRLLGSHGWTKTMYVKLLQRFGLETDVARHLASTYGDRAWSVCSMAEPTGERWPIHGRRLDSQYPYIEAEVRYACRSEYAATAVDFLARRSRLTFLNAEAAVSALPRVIELMSKELGWDKKRQAKEYSDSIAFMESMGVPESRVAALQKLGLNGLTKIMNDKKAKAKALEKAEGQGPGVFAALAGGNSGPTAGPSGSKSLAGQAAAATEGSSILGRAQFSADEMEELRERFQHLDVDGDGKVGLKDLRHVLNRLGYTDVDDRTIAGVLNEVDVAQKEYLQFDSFLDIVAASKDASIENAFTYIVKETSKVGSSDPAGAYAGEQSSERDKRRTIPTSRSGGGW